MKIPPVLRRGLFHILGGLCVPVAALLMPRIVILVSLAVVTLCLVAFELVRFRFPVANRWFFRIYQPVARKSERSRLTGASYLLIGSLISLLIFDRDIAVTALLLMAVGDAVAGVVGTTVGKRRVFGKTLEGDLACLVSCVATGLVCYYAGLKVPLPNSLAGALSATVVEAVSLPVNDNLTMPLLAGAVMTVFHV